MMVSSVPIKIGLTNPKPRMLAEICSICESEWARALLRQVFSCWVGRGSMCPTIRGEVISDGSFYCKVEMACALPDTMNRAGLEGHCLGLSVPLWCGECGEQCGENLEIFASVESVG